MRLSQCKEPEKTSTKPGFLSQKFDLLTHTRTTETPPFHVTLTPSLSAVQTKRKYVDLRRLPKIWGIIMMERKWSCARLCETRSFCDEHSARVFEDDVLCIRCSARGYRG